MFRTIMLGAPGRNRDKCLAQIRTVISPAPPAGVETTMVIVLPAKETGVEVGVGFTVGLGWTIGDGFGSGPGVGVGLGVGVTLGAQAKSNARTRENEIDNHKNFCLVTSTPPS